MHTAMLFTEADPFIDIVRTLRLYCLYFSIYWLIELAGFSEPSSCVKVEVAVLGSPSLIVIMVSVDIMQH